MSEESTEKKSRLDLLTLRAIPRGVWALGFVSLFMDVSSEMIHALLPIYLVTVLGVSALSVGIIEGIAEATAAIVKIFSGAISDWLGKRKLLAAIGYGLAAFTKPVFPLASSVGWLVAARFVDRVGKGIRGAPRDALVADITPQALRGASFGLRQSLDTIGAFVGPLAAIGLMLWTANSFKTVFWIAVIPAFVSLALILFLVKEPSREKPERPPRFPLQRAEISRLPLAYWLVVGFSSLFTLARFSEAFLVLKAQATGFPVAFVPAILVLMNVIYALAAYPAGVLSDGKNGRNRVLVIGLGFLLAADLVLALADSVALVLLGVALWGLHMGFTQGLLATLVADTAPSQLRGTAFGIFNLATGIVLLAASVIAGGLWEYVGSQATFFTGAGITAFSLLLFLMIARRA